MKPKQRKIIHPLLGPFTVVDKLGEGAFARILLAMHDDLSFPVCFKIFKAVVDGEAGSVDEMAKAEFDVSKSICHPLIMETYDIWDSKGRKVMLLEYVEGQSLLHYANNFGPLQEFELRSLFGQMVLAVESLHQQKVIHRDLKCENIIVDPYGNIRIIDFGFARTLANVGSMARTLCGSPAYLAPEIIMSRPYDYKVDIWSLGVILYAISVGKLPFDDDNIGRQIAKITKEDPTYPPEIAEPLKDLLRGMLRKDPAARFTLNDIKAHPWMTRDAMGRQFRLSNKYLTSFERKLYGSVNIDILAMMRFTGDAAALADNLNSGTRTRDALTYRIMRKRTISDEMSRLRQNLFRNVASTPRLAFPSFLAKSHEKLPVIPEVAKDQPPGREPVRVLNLGHDTPAVLLPMRRRSTLVAAVKNTQMLVAKKPSPVLYQHKF